MHNGLMTLKEAVPSIVFFFGPNPNAELVHERNGGFGIAPYDPMNEDHVTISAPYDNFLDMLSVIVTDGDLYRDGLACRFLGKVKNGWHRNSKTPSGTSKQCAHLFHRKGCDWRISGPDRFGDEVTAEQQRIYRARK